MNTEIKDRWVTALRSGEYQQGFFKLKPLENRHCCLGVLTDLYIKEIGREWRVIEEEYDKVIGFVDPSYSGFCSSFLPPTVQKWAELSSHNPLVYDDSLQRSVDLSTLNDNGKTFVEIANLIEKQL